VIEELRALYRLQTIDLELDELNEGGGDLPGEIEALTRRIADIESVSAKEAEKLAQVRSARNLANGQIADMRLRLKDLNERLRTVRNNREYEATTADIASNEDQLGQLERSITTFDQQEANSIRQQESLRTERSEIETALNEKKETLDAIHNTNADEVNELVTARQEALGSVSEELLQQYNHIRRAHPDAVVKARRGACSGCYRAIPPQTLVEMRRSERIFHCEHCGRIIVDEDIDTAPVAADNTDEQSA